MLCNLIYNVNKYLVIDPDRDVQFFSVTHLTDKMFHNGFRIATPEFKDTPASIESDTELVNDYLQYVDHEIEYIPKTQFEYKSRYDQKKNNILMSRGA